MYSLQYKVMQNKYDRGPATLAGVKEGIHWEWCYLYMAFGMEEVFHFSVLKKLPLRYKYYNWTLKQMEHWVKYTKKN